MREPVRVLSDLHLGHKVSRIENVAALRPLIAGAGTVIFNGDTWQELARPFFQRSQSMLGDLHELCREEGVDTVFLAGNHDPGWPGPGWVTLAGGRIVITHGDALLFAGSPWKREILLKNDHIRQIWRQHPRADHQLEQRLAVAREIATDLCSVEHPTGRTFFKRAWDAMVPPRRAHEMLQAWASQGRVGAEFCERYFPQAEMLIIGHFHWQGSWLSKGRRVLNTGSFMAPGRAHWVEWNEGCLSRGIIEESPDTCRMGETLDVWRF